MYLELLSGEKVGGGVNGVQFRGKSYLVGVSRYCDGDANKHEKRRPSEDKREIEQRDSR